MVLRILDNNILTNKSQTVIPLGMQGAGKTLTSMMILRKLLRKCGYGEQADIVKHVEAAWNVLRPMVSAAASGSKMSTRMVRNITKNFLIFIIAYFRLCLPSVRWCKDLSSE